MLTPFIDYGRRTTVEKPSADTTPEIIPEIPTEILRRLEVAREAWRLAEWVVTPRVMERTGIDTALDDLNEWKNLEADYGG